MGAIKYRAVYELNVRAVDVSSTRGISNIMHSRCGPATVGAPPAYGADLPGSTLQTVVDNYLANWRTTILPILSVNYQLMSMTLTEITGHGFGGTPSPIFLIGGLAGVTQIWTGAPHGLITGDNVFLQGGNLLNNTNGVWVVTVQDTTHFTLNGSTYVAPLAPSGTWSKVTGADRVSFGDQAAAAGIVTTDKGTVAGESINLFSTLSTRKLTSRAGRKWRGRMLLSPVGESQVKDGRFTDAQIALNNTALESFRVSLNANGGTAGDLRDNNYLQLLSKTTLLAGAVIPTESETWAAVITSWPCQPNQGSIRKRKPKLTQPIS